MRIKSRRREANRTGLEPTTKICLITEDSGHSLRECDSVTLILFLGSVCYVLPPVADPRAVAPETRVPRPPVQPCHADGPLPGRILPGAKAVHRLLARLPRRPGTHLLIQGILRTLHPILGQ